MKFTSPVYSAASGSIAGVTYSRNRSGMYTRARAVPTNPNTSRQQQVRSTFTGAVQAWSQLLDADQRQAWNTYAANVPTTNSLGHVVHLSGQQWFIASYSARYIPAINQSAMLGLNAPTIFNRGETIEFAATTQGGVMGSLGIYETTGDIQTTFTATGDDGEIHRALLVYVGVPQNPGRNYYKGPYRLSGVIYSNTAQSQYDWAGAQTTRLDGGATWSPGQRVPVKARLVYDDGRIATPWEAILTVVEEASP